MTTWRDRTIEERNLLNPAFCAVVTWSLANGYRVEQAKSEASSHGMALELLFVGASFVLRGQTRECLPGVVTTSMPAWIQDHPLQRSAVAKGVEVLRPYVREGIIFGARRGLITFQSRGQIMASQDKAKAVAEYEKKTTLDARSCVVKALFIGRWLYRSGTASTVMDLVGVRP
jgi:hypothetical protein